MDDLGTGDGRRRETPYERLDRNFAELLQELRVAQTGVQILFAFLLTLPFAARFTVTPPRDRAVYAVTLAACAASIVFLIAPVSYHRLVFRQGRKGEVVNTTSILALVGTACLLAAVVGAVFLVADVVLDFTAALIMAAATAILAISLWYALPLSRGRSTSSRSHDVLRRTHQESPPVTPGHRVDGLVEEPTFTHGRQTLNESRSGTHTAVGVGPEMPTIDGLDALAQLVADADRGRNLYVRWSHGPATDMNGTGREQSSRDELTGVEMPGLSANPLRVEPWWQDRSVKLWVARRLDDYRHLQCRRGENVRAWILLGNEQGRGPDNETLVVCVWPLAWISEATLRACESLVQAEQADHDHGSPFRHDRA
jgi:hypothetical protein